MSEEHIFGRQINFAAKRKTKRVYIPELDATVILRELSARQLRDLDPKDQVAQLAMMIVDEKGEQEFKTPEDLANLAEMSVNIFTDLIVAAAELNGTSESAVEATKKNSSGKPNGAFESASPAS